jgi:hypothetical protein
MFAVLALAVCTVLGTCGCAAQGGNAATSGAGGSADATGVEPAMKGTLYETGRVFGQMYCSPCHWKGGQHAKQPLAYPAFQVDTYDQWATGGTIVPAVLDKWNPDGTVMPPPEAPQDPPDDVRKSILDWVRQGSPNTPSGT